MDDPKDMEENSRKLDLKKEGGEKKKNTRKEK